MAFLVTPGQLRLRSEFYHQLGSMLTAGLGLPQALDSLHTHPPSFFYRKPIARMLDLLNQGATFAEALRALGKWLPVFDVALVEAGERSGRLDSCLRALSVYYNDRAQLLSEAMGRLAYPVFLAHFAVFAWWFSQFFISGNLAAYLRNTLGLLAPFYIAGGLLIYACQGRHGEMWRSMLERLARFVPSLGSGRHHLALARLSLALEALISAGVPIMNAWELAAEACGSPALRRAVLQWKPRLVAGETPAETVRTCSQFPQLFASEYHAAEISGKLDEMLRRMHGYYQDSGVRKLKRFAVMAPLLVYIGIVIAIAVKVVSFWTNYYGEIFKQF
jgi:type II secretory pathway component PulF